MQVPFEALILVPQVNVCLHSVSITGMPRRGQS